MPSYAPNYTPRYRARYVAAGVEHTILTRSPRGASLSSTTSTGQGLFHNIFDAISALLADDFAWISAEVAEVDSDVFIPAAVPVAVTGVQDWVGDAWSGKKRVSALTFSGRAPNSRARVSMYGINIDSDFIINTGGDGIVTPGEVPAIATIASLLQASRVAGSGDNAFYYGRATHKVNDKLLKLVRRGTIG